MTVTAFRSTNEAVLILWEFSVEEQHRFTQRMLAEQHRLGRGVYRTTNGLCLREEVVGIADEPGMGVPPGWCTRLERDFLRPIDGPAGQPARDWLAAHQPPPAAEERLRVFGLAAVHIAGDEVFWPGVELLDDGLYITWGRDTGWTGDGFFQPIPVEEYDTARLRSA